VAVTVIGCKRALAVPSFILLLLGVCLATTCRATPLADADVVIIVRSGTNADGSERFDVADSSDARAAHLWNYAQQNTAMQRVLQYYHDVQSTTGDDLTADEQEALSYYGGTTDPVYIEIEEGGGGAYCDWKGRYTVELPNGQTTSVVSPKVVVRRNDAVFTGGDTSLQVQTLVHEIGHAIMSKHYGYEKLPYTDWLTKEHAGGTTSDAKLALIEGWAEFIGAYFTGRYTVANDPTDALRDNRYAYTDIYTRTTLRSAGDMQKTEGWVATAFLNLIAEGAVTLGDIDAVMRSKTPQTFQALVLGLEEQYPSKTAAIRTVLADTSMGQLHPEYRTTGSSLNQMASTVTTAGSNTFAGLGLSSSDGGNGLGKLVPGLVGAVLGAMAGGPFGAVGMLVGAAAGFALGQLLSGMLETSAAARTPAAADSTLAASPASVAAPAAATSVGSSDADLTALRAEVNEAFKAYLQSVRQGTRDEQNAAMHQYRSLQATFRARVAAGQER